MRSNIYSERYSPLVAVWARSWWPIFKRRGFELVDVEQECYLALIERSVYLAEREKLTGEDPVTLAKVVVRRAIQRKLLGRAKKNEEFCVEETNPVLIEDKRQKIDVALAVCDMIDAARQEVGAFFADHLESVFFGEEGLTLPTSCVKWVTAYLRRQCE